MGNKETVGIATIIVGVLLVIGAVRGTWKKLFQDVVVGQSAPTTTPTSLSFVPIQVPVGNSANLESTTSTTNQQNAPSPYVAVY